jgi:predicted transcriptional regulator
MAITKPKKPKLPKKPRANAPVATWEKYNATIDARVKSYNDKLKAYQTGISKREALKKTAAKKAEQLQRAAAR